MGSLLEALCTVQGPGLGISGQTTHICPRYALKMRSELNSFMLLLLQICHVTFLSLSFPTAAGYRTPRLSISLEKTLGAVKLLPWELSQEEWGAGGGWLIQEHPVS